MSGTSGALRLIELTSTRLCHDISGLIGSLDHALSGTVQDAAPDPSLEGTLLSAAQALTARLELRRAAWGPDNGPVPLALIQRLVHGLPAEVSVDLSALDRNTVFPPSTGRIVLNLFLLAADALPVGGTVTLAGAQDDLFVRIAGPDAAWPAGMAVCLHNEAEARSALTEGRSLQMALTALLAHAAGIRLSALYSPIVRSEPAILRLGG